MKPLIQTVLLTVGFAICCCAQAQPEEQASEQTNTTAETDSAPDRRLLGEQGGFAGPASTTQMLEEDAAPREPMFRFGTMDRTLQPWFDWKDGVKDDTGLQFGAAYTALYQGTSDSGRAASGIFRLSGNWTLVGREGKNFGRLVFSSDYRHRYTERTPGEYDGLQAGYHGITGAMFNNLGWVLGDLNWQQAWLDGSGGVVIGRYDPNDFFDVLGSSNPWTMFQNLAILFNTSIALPDWSYGVGVGQWFSDQYYIKAAVNDANGTASELGFFDGGGEFYTTAEIGWSPSSEGRYLANFHVMGWHVDERTANNIGPEGHGIAIGGNWTWNEKFMIFSKLGWSDGQSQLYNRSFTVGGVYSISKRMDLIGYGFNWGSPSAPGLRDQYSNELFYRVQFAENLALTPSVQLLINPALNPDEDSVWVFGIRARITL